MNPKQLHGEIIVPALRNLGEQYATPSAAILLLATAAQETLCAEYVRQIGGPALGIYQMEKATFIDTLQRNESRFPELSHEVGRLVYDLRYATQIARLKYWLDPEPLPHPEDMGGMWSYYKKIWNTPAGAATKDQFVTHWEGLVLPVLKESI